MTFYWNAFGILNLCIEVIALASAALCCWRVVRSRFPSGLPMAPGWAVVEALRFGVLLSLIPWLIGVAMLGGIFGLSLLSRVLWMLATVGIPSFAVILWFKWRRAWFWVLIVLPLVFKFYGEKWEPNNLEIQHIRIAIPGVRRPVRIVHLSDLQTDGIGAMQLAARSAANEFDPDVIAFTGDVLNHSSLVPEVKEYLRGFKHRSGAFFVTGNVDGLLPPEKFCREVGFEFMDGSARILDVDGTRIGILGLGLSDFRDSALLGRLILETKAVDIRVLLSHVPDALEIARKAPVHLLLSGHTHGGQIRLPWIVPIITMSGVPRTIAGGGLHQVDGLKVLVSRGLGMEGHIAPRVRTFCRPQLLLVELVPEEMARDS